MLQLVAFICCTVTGWFATQAFVAHLTKTLLVFLLLFIPKYMQNVISFLFLFVFLLSIITKQQPPGLENEASPSVLRAVV